MSKKSLKIALLCGGPSLERGISLNSARSVCDHLNSEEIMIYPIYFDHFKKPYAISRGQLYSNTPSDFDFKLHQSAKPLSETAFKNFLVKMDLAFPVMHGSFGEDGQIQRILERNNCPYIGSPVEACKIAFDKYEANEFIKKNGFYTWPSVVLKSHLKDHKKIVSHFFKKHEIKRAIVKPATGGSSIGVYSVSTVEEALEKSHELFSKRVDTRVVIEPFCKGTEFTVIVLENRFGLPVAVLPTEMDLSYDDHQIFDYRKKYLASRQVTYHCPPRFDNQMIERIQIQAEHLFKTLGMRDFARFDGWLLENGKLWFSDFNPISGMEQNSFLFQQTSQIGMSHKDLLRYVVKNACRRYKINFPKTINDTGAHSMKEVNVLFGGKTAERQVSVMSGTNVWLKLRESKEIDPKPFLLDTNYNVWKLPYSHTLNHTVEEIEETCKAAKKSEERLKELKTRVLDKLAALPGEINEKFFLPEKMTLDQFIKQSNYVFIGLHGGIGEDGTLQKKLTNNKVKFNGSHFEGSRICMNKYETGQKVVQLEDSGIRSAQKMKVKLIKFKDYQKKHYKNFWKDIKIELGSNTIIVKPMGDGCSAGIARLHNEKDLEKYITYAQKGARHIPEKKLSHQHGIIEMPTTKMEEVMFEQFIITDEIRVIGNKLKWKTKTNWIEITMGVLEKNGKYHALNPSLTVARGSILTLEEKFQGGTGVNITPPPKNYVKPSVTTKARKRMEKVAQALKIKGYARIDAFMHIKTGDVIIIEANSTPALTPSTVIYHQGLCEKPAMHPTKLLEKIIDNSL